MNSNTLLQSIHNPSQFYTLGDAMYAFGKHNISSLAGNVFIFYSENIPNAAFKASLKRGRPPHHIKKTDGKIKKIYKTKGKYYSIQNDVENIKYNSIPKLKKSIQFIENLFKAHSEKRNINAIIIQKHARTFLIKQNIQKAKQLLINGIDFIDDPLTCERMVNPVIINCDWSNNNKLIYDYSSIKNLALIERRPVYYFVDRNNETQYYYTNIVQKDIFNNMLYKSPMTRAVFTLCDVKNIKTNVWYKYGKLLQHKKLNKLV